LSAGVIIRMNFHVPFIKTEPVREGRVTPFAFRFQGLACMLAVLSVLVVIPVSAATDPLKTSDGLSKLPPAPPPVLRLSLNETIALFLRQNFDLIISSFGIDSAKGQQITARLFPNPTLIVNTAASFTQGLTPSNSGQISPQIQQLFEMAGKRGYRIESAAFGTQSAEANFEDAIRQLGFTLKDAYYRVQLAQRRLAIAEENRDRFARILEVNTIRFKKGYIAEVDLIRIRLQIVDFQAQVIQAIQEADQGRADLRTLLGVTPAVELLLTTELDYHRVEPDIDALRLVAIEARPDIRAKRLTQSQRMADLKLAKAYRYPDVTIGAGYAVQGARGPDLPQMPTLGINVPLPIFNRNQGGIVQSVSWTLKEEVRFDKEGILARDWASYPILTMPEAPKVEVELINRPNERPLGSGEGSQGPAVAAVANAFANATGKRVRDLPLHPARVKAALV